MASFGARLQQNIPGAQPGRRVPNFARGGRLRTPSAGNRPTQARPRSQNQASRGGAKPGFKGDRPFRQNLQRLRQEFRSGTLPVRLEQSRLAATDPQTGLTLFGAAEQQARRNLERQQQDVKVAAGQAGLIRSGFRQRAAQDLTSDFLTNLQVLSGQLGPERLRELKRTVAQARQSFDVLKGIEVENATVRTALRKQQLGGL